MIYPTILHFVDLAMMNMGMHAKMGNNIEEITREQKLDCNTLKNVLQKIWKLLLGVERNVYS